jgi:diguanylate cyclase (GGDEF)-like protein
MADCKYYSFYALAKINDPELLYDAFQQQIAPGHAEEIEIEVYENGEGRWRRLTRSGSQEPGVAEDILQTLQQRFGGDDPGSSFYDKKLERWFCSYRPISSKHFVLAVKSSDPERLTEEDYLQFLFHFYCHQLQMLQGTYRDALTGLYNRRAFNEKLLQLLGPTQNYQRRAIDFTPTVFAMLDIDHFKVINDRHGHLYGDEVLLLLAQLMSDSFRANDLLFRYGGEEFAMVLMDITPEQACQSLERFREKVANYDFPNLDRVTISIGFTRFDRDLSMDELISQADNALYYCKSTTRNVLHSYQDLVEKELIPLVKAPRSTSIEIF